MAHSILLIPFIWLLNISIINAGEPVNVTQKLSSSVQAGSDFTVEVTIHKANIIGFAKFQAELPEGFTATPEETKNGTFSFTDHKVKFIWMTLPADQEFKISYKIVVAQTASGIKSVGGVFAYVENNETQKFRLESSTVSISEGTSSTTNSSVSTTSSTTSTTETSGGINKTTETSSEKKQENTAVESREIGTENTNSKTSEVSEKKKGNTPIKKTVTTTSSNKTNTPALRTPNSKSSTKKSYPSTPTSSGIIFRVQLIAKQEDVGKEYFKTNYQIDATVYMDNIDGRYKYTTGNLKTYNQAKDLCSKMKQQGVTDAFVVAYRDNQRITVQEAIAATK